MNFMKHHQPNVFLITLMLLSATANFFGADLTVPGRPPVLDSQGRFWIYRNGPLHPKMPFTPYGWMSDATNLSQVIQVDLECRDRPNLVVKPPAPEREYCIRVKVTWGEATWASVAFISGLDKPAWWGETDNVRQILQPRRVISKKKLALYARGQQRRRSHQSPNRRSWVTNPSATALPSLSLQKTLKFDAGLDAFWKWISKTCPHPNSQAICNGFGVVVEQSSQPGSPGETQFYLDDIYSE